jgi:hypothetical protein
MSNTLSNATADSTSPGRVSPSIPLSTPSGLAIRRKPFARTSLRLVWSRCTERSPFTSLMSRKLKPVSAKGRRDQALRPASEPKQARTVRTSQARPPRSRFTGSRTALSIRFQADNDLKRIIVDATRRRVPGIDFQTAQAAHLDSLDDEAVLRLAASQSIILVSHDKRTMPQTLTAFVASGCTSPGVLLVIPQNASIWGGS